MIKTNIKVILNFCLTDKSYTLIREIYYSLLDTRSNPFYPLSCYLQGCSSYLFKSKSVNIVNSTIRGIVVDSKIKFPSLLISTNTGLFLFKGNELIQLFSGYRFHGTSNIGSTWITTEISEGHKFGRIIKFKIGADGVLDVKEIFRTPCQYFHQADFVGEYLYVTDSSWATFGDRLHKMKFSKDMSKLESHVSVKLERPDNYIHINSIYSVNGKQFIMFHNNTILRGVKSVIMEYDLEWNFVEQHEIGGTHAHNIFALKSGLCFLDSAKGRMIWGGKSIEVSDGFTRGLAVSDKYIFVGSSIRQERSERYDTAPSIYLFEKETLKKLSCVKLPNIGDITEIRIIDEVDYTRSNHAFLKL